MVSHDDTAALKECGWHDTAIWEITALTSFFNFSGRLEAASGLPPDEIPEGAKFAEVGGGVERNARSRATGQLGELEGIARARSTRGRRPPGDPPRRPTRGRSRGDVEKAQ